MKSMMILLLLFPFLIVANPQRLQQLAEEAAVIQQKGGDQLNYAQWLLLYLKKEHNIRVSGVRYWRMERNNRRGIDPLDLFTGMTAIRESLQLETIGFSGDDGKKMVSIKDLKRVTIKSHPFREMMKGKKPVYFPLATKTPEDFYYMRMGNMKQTLELFDMITGKWGSLLQRYLPDQVGVNLKEKYLTQLALLDNKEARNFYDSVIEEMAIVGSDPFLVTGTDMSVIYRVKNPLMFHTTIGMHRAYFKAKYQAKENDLEIATLKVTLLSSRDQLVKSYMVNLDEKTVVISNSPKALERIINTHQGKYRSLAQIDDFLYMRTVYSGDDQKEAGFLYLSDSFVRHLVSPELRIKEARRMAALQKLTYLQRMILLYIDYKGFLPRSVKALLTELIPDHKNYQKRLASQMFHLKDLTINQFQVVSKTYGHFGYFKPNIDDPIMMITAREGKAYERFVERYSRFWQEYFDPIGVRFSMDKMNKGIKAEICILPLIKMSAYNQLQEVIGGAPITFGANRQLSDEIMRFSLKLNLSALRGFIPREIFGFSGGVTPDQIFGDQISFALLDTTPTADFNSRAFMNMFSRWGRLQETLFIGVLAWTFFHPVRVTIPVKNEKLFWQVLKSVQTVLDKERSSDFYATYYLQKQGAYTIGTYSWTLFKFLTLRFYFSIVDGNLEVTTAEDALLRILNTKRSKTQSKYLANGIAALYPKSIQQERGLFRANMVESILLENQRNINTLVLLHRILKDGKKVVNYLNNHGMSLKNPLKQPYTFKNNRVVDGITTDHIIDRDRLLKGIDSFFNINKILILFRLTPEGVMSEIHIQE